MFKKISFLFLLLIYALISFGQTVNFSGFIKAYSTSEPLPYATCYNELKGKGIICNEHGFFSLNLPKEEIKLAFSYVGFKKTFITLNLQKDTIVIIYLEPYELEAVEVKKNTTPFYTLSMSGKVTVPLKKIDQIPQFMGEKDILKAITILPGVSFGREGYSTLLVRGGNRDQNLILLDGCPIFNVNHLGGFISLFNTNAIQHVDLYKNSYPARFGEKISSVLDIRMREGNREKLKGEISTGILSTGILVEGPVINKKTSILVSARSSYLYLLQHFARQDYRNSSQGSYTDYNFFDVNTKISHNISESKKIFFNFYSGGDYFKLNEKDIKPNHSMYDINGYNINNIAGSVSYQFVKNKKFYYTISLYSSTYHLSSKSELTISQVQYTDSTISKLKTSISENGVHLSVNFQPSGFSHNIRIGAKISSFSILPGVFINNQYSYPNNNSFSRRYGDGIIVHPMNYAFYYEDDWNITKLLTINSGLRGSIWQSGSYTKGMVEPRLSIRIDNQTNKAFCFGYSISQQPIHGVVSMNYGLEREIWLPASEKLFPQIAHQISCGAYFKSEIINADYSIEGFYKKMKNLLDFGAISGEQSISSSLEELVFKDGKGEVYGLEFLFEKRSDFIYSSFSYTISKNIRQFSGLNSGKPYPSDFDRLHDLCLLLNYTPSSKVSYGLLFVFQSGTPTTLPSGFLPGNNGFPGYYIYSSVNNHRLPLYHRLDFSMKRTWDNKRGRKKVINFSIYNLYARINPVYIYIENGVVIKKSYFRIIPSISYTYEF